MKNQISPQKIWLFPLALSLFLSLSLFYLWLGQLDPQDKIETHTTSLLEKLHKLSRLEVMQAQLVSYKTYARHSWLGLNQDEFIMLVRGEAIYGVDLKNVSIDAAQKPLIISLPPVQVLHVQLKPDSIEYLGLSKGWFTSQNQFEAMKAEALNALYQDLKNQANADHLKAEAQKNTEIFLSQWLKGLGIEDFVFGPYRSEVFPKN